MVGTIEKPVENCAEMFNCLEKGSGCRRSSYPSGLRVDIPTLLVRL